eukprot:g14107.t2
MPFNARTIHDGYGDSSSVQTYNFTGLGKKQGSVTTKCSVRRKRKHDWRPANCLPPSHGKSPPVPGRLRATAPSQWSIRERGSDCVMNRWTASFDADRARFQSISVMCEQRLRKACVMTEHAPMPNEFRTMAACEALGTLLPVFERYRSLVTLVMKELLRSIYEDPDLVINQFLAWLHIGELEGALERKEKHEGTLLHNLTSARNSMRSLLGKDSLLITRFIFANWKYVVENSRTLRRRFERIRLRVWFSGLRTRLTRRMNQEAKYQLGLRERELMLHSSEKEQGTKNAGRSTPGPAEENTQITRAATTRELIVAALLEQAKTLMAQVQEYGNGSSQENRVIMASMTKMAAAAKLAEERIRLDIGDDMSVEDEDLGIGHSTTGTQTDAVSFDSRPGGRASGTDPEPPSPQNNRETMMATPSTNTGGLRSVQIAQGVGNSQADGGGSNRSDAEFGVQSNTIGAVSSRNISKLSRYALQAMVIPDFYTRKVVSDASDDLRGGIRLEPREAVEAFVFEICGGDSFKAELKLAAMKTAVRKHGTSSNRRISLFGTLVGWIHEQSYIPQAMDLYTTVMLRIFNNRAHQMSARMIKGDGHAYVPLETVAPVVEALLPVMDEGEHFQHRSHVLMCTVGQQNNMWALSEARKMDLTRSISALARPAGETHLGPANYADAYKTDTLLPYQVLDVDVVMEKIMNAWFEQRHENRRQLVKTIETHRAIENGKQRLGFARFSDMLWDISGYSVSTPAMYRLFKLTAVSDKQNTKKFSFSQASALAEHILRAIFHLTTDKQRAKEILEEGEDRYLKEKAQENWQNICTNTTRKSRGKRLRLYISLQARMRGWKIRWRHEMSTRIQRIGRGYMAEKEIGRGKYITPGN